MSAKAKHTPVDGFGNNRSDTLRISSEVEVEVAIEDAAKAAFIQAQSVYRSDHDHFPLKHTWETTTETIREGWRKIGHAAVEAAIMPPVGTQPEPRQPRAFFSEQLTPVWYQNLRGFIQGVFPADERWKAIFLKRLDHTISSHADMLEALRSVASSNPDWELVTSALAKAEGGE